jgi:uncharacterized membrane protein YbhN (UPF0104 family)
VIHRRRAAIWILKAGVTGAGVGLAWRKMENVEPGGMMVDADWRWLLACILLQCLMAVVSAVRWRYLCRLENVPLRKYAYYVFLGNTLGLIMPSMLLSEGARTFAFGRRYGDMSSGIAATLVGRGTGFCIQCVLAFGALAWFWDEIVAAAAGRLEFRSSLTAAFAALAAATAIGVSIFLRRNPKILGVAGLVVSRLRTGRILAVTLALSLLLQALSATGVYALFRTAGYDIGWWRALFIPPVMQLALAFPVSVGGVGVREYLSILLYADIGGVPARTALAASLLGYVPMGAFVGITFMWMAYRRLVRRGSAPGS